MISVILSTFSQSSLEKYLFRLSVHFLIILFGVLLLSYVKVFSNCFCVICSDWTQIAWKTLLFHLISLYLPSLPSGGAKTEREKRILAWTVEESDFIWGVADSGQEPPTHSPPSLLLPSTQADTKALVFPSFVPTGSSNHISPYFQGNLIPALLPNHNENPKPLSFLCSLRPFLDMLGASLVSL